MEGVESESSMAALTSYGADRVQGYHFGRPEPVATLRERVTRQILVRG